MSICFCCLLFMWIPTSGGNGLNSFIVINIVTMLILAIPMMILNGYEWGLINNDLDRLNELKWTEICTDPES